MALPYIIDETGKIRQADSYQEYAEWWSRTDQDSLIVDRTDIRNLDGEIVSEVVTKFSGNLEEVENPPRVWATVWDGEVWRFATREEAKKRHKSMVRVAEHFHGKTIQARRARKPERKGWFFRQ